MSGVDSETGRPQFSVAEERLHAPHGIFHVKLLHFHSGQTNRRQIFQVRGGLFALFQIKVLHVQRKNLKQ